MLICLLVAEGLLLFGNPNTKIDVMSVLNYTTTIVILKIYE